MNLDQLTSQFEANKGPILATAAAGVVGFALYQRHKSGTGNASAPAQGVAVDPGTYSSGGQLAGSAYSSAASDAYDLFQPQLEALGQKLNSVPVSQAPTSPIATSITTAQRSGTYAGYSNGIFEVENDGSLYHLSPTEWQGIIKDNGGKTPGNYYHFSGDSPTNYSGTRNLQAKINTAAGKTS